MYYYKCVTCKWLNKYSYDYFKDNFSYKECVCCHQNSKVMDGLILAQNFFSIQGFSVKDVLKHICNSCGYDSFYPPANSLPYTGKCIKCTHAFKYNYCQLCGTVMSFATGNSFGIDFCLKCGCTEEQALTEMSYPYKGYYSYPNSANKYSVHYPNTDLLSMQMDQHYGADGSYTIPYQSSKTVSYFCGKCGYHHAITEQYLHGSNFECFGCKEVVSVKHCKYCYQNTAFMAYPYAFNELCKCSKCFNVYSSQEYKYEYIKVDAKKQDLEKTLSPGTITFGDKVVGSSPNFNVAVNTEDFSTTPYVNVPVNANITFSQQPTNYTYSGSFDVTVSATGPLDKKDKVEPKSSLLTMAYVSGNKTRIYHYMNGDKFSCGKKVPKNNVEKLSQKDCDTVVKRLSKYICEKCMNGAVV
jgi:hypothetical protein